MAQKPIVVGPDAKPDLEALLHQYEKLDRQVPALRKKIKAGRLTTEDVQCVIERRNPFGDALTIQDCISVLGKDKVVTAGQAGEFWKRDAPTGLPIFLTESELATMAEQNKAGAADWRVVFVLGMSLREQYTLRGDDPAAKPCFYKDWDWWRKPEQDGWATRRPGGAGYAVLDVKKRLHSMAIVTQDAELAKLGPDFFRADECDVTEAAFSVFGVHGELLLPGWYHWGRPVTTYRRRVYVGHHGDSGWSVNGAHPGVVDDSIGVVVARKFLRFAA